MTTKSHTTSDGEKADLLRNSRSIVERAKASGLLTGPGQVLKGSVDRSLVNGAAAQCNGVRVAFVEITPAMARQWLRSNNARNRKLRETTVEAYATDMRNGAWRLNHQGIAFDENDVLMDGQHRLAAIEASGVSQTMLVSSGWPAQPDQSKSRVMDTVDRGLSRSVADLLGLQHGIEDARQVVMAANSIALLCRRANDKSFKLSVDVVLKVVEVFKPGVQHAVRHRSRSVGLRSASVIGAIAFAWSVEPVKVSAFYDSLKTGAGLSAGHPALSLRNNLLELNSTNRSTTKHDPRALSHAVLTHCHAMITGAKLPSLSVLQNAVRYFFERQSEAVERVRSFIEPAVGGVKR